MQLGYYNRKPATRVVIYDRDVPSPSRAPVGDSLESTSFFGTERWETRSRRCGTCTWLDVTLATRLAPNVTREEESLIRPGIFMLIYVPLDFAIDQCPKRFSDSPPAALPCFMHGYPIVDGPRLTRLPTSSRGIRKLDIRWYTEWKLTKKEKKINEASFHSLFTMMIRRILRSVI